MRAENKIYLECDYEELRKIRDASETIDKILSELGKITSGCDAVDNLSEAKNFLVSIYETRNILGNILEGKTIE